MTSNKDHGDDMKQLAKLREGGSGVSLAEKRLFLRAVADKLKRGDPPMISQEVMPVIRLLVGDENWEVRQDVAELLLFVPEQDFPDMAAKLANDPNGYVRRSAERNTERRRKTELEAKRATRGIEQVSEQYESLTKQVGGEVAEKAITLGEKRFTLLANALVHDLLQLLGPLKFQAQTLKKGLATGDAALRQHAADLAEGLDFLEQSIRDAEAYAKALPHERHAEWIHEVVRQAKDLSRQNLKAQGFDLRAIALEDKGIPEIRVVMSRQLIVQALTNILTNAYESFIKRGGKLAKGKIVLSVRGTGDRVTVEVRDNGCGLSEEELASLRAFLPGKKNMNKKRSTGYGLLIAKKNIEAHDGTLTVESNLGKGTTVAISLPLSAREETDGHSSGR